jgi:EAL domain-containing protein (putative c-di-GMP-specific phosphodiesterase class I)
VDASHLVLEVTEGVLIDDPGEAIAVLSDLRSLGVRLALDDFGTGYCSLAYLRDLPVDIVKIDRSFVAALDTDPTARAITGAVTDLAHVLGMSVTAEGVETARQNDAVVSMGCDHVQGFFHARPMSALDVALTLKSAHLPR